MALGYRTYLRSQSKLTRTMVPVVTDMYFANDMVDYSVIRLFETTDINRPIFSNPKCFIEGEYLVVVGDAYSTISAIDLVYIRDPKALHLTVDSDDYTTTCELPVELHERIVDVAIRIAGETVNINDIKNKNDNGRNAS
jgi:hypothetical protein